jgi:hypothetical protein
MRYYWIRDRVAQGQIRIVWQAGRHNLAEMFTKRHPPTYYRDMRSKYFHEEPVHSNQCLHTCAVIRMC